MDSLPQSATHQDHGGWIFVRTVHDAATEQWRGIVGEGLYNDRFCCPSLHQSRRTAQECAERTTRRLNREAT